MSVHINEKNSQRFNFWTMFNRGKKQVEKMDESRVNIYKKNGAMLGYFRDPRISQFGADEYEIHGVFHDGAGVLVNKLEFNPQSMPYWAEVKGVSGLKHSQLTNVYVQRGRQPITVSALGS